jgi:hypothetical protein
MVLCFSWTHVLMCAAVQARRRAGRHAYSFGSGGGRPTVMVPNGGLGISPSVLHPPREHRNCEVLIGMGQGLDVKQRRYRTKRKLKDSAYRDADQRRNSSLTYIQQYQLSDALDRCFLRDGGY